MAAGMAAGMAAASWHRAHLQIPACKHERRALGQRGREDLVERGGHLQLRARDGLVLAHGRMRANADPRGRQHVADVEEPQQGVHAALVGRQAVAVERLGGPLHGLQGGERDLHQPHLRAVCKAPQRHALHDAAVLCQRLVFGHRLCNEQLGLAGAGARRQRHVKVGEELDVRRH